MQGAQAGFRNSHTKSWPLRMVHAARKDSPPELLWLAKCTLANKLITAAEKPLRAIAGMTVGNGAQNASSY